MSKIEECKWFTIDDKIVVLVSKEYNKSIIRYSDIIYHNGELQSNYSELYHNNPCNFYRKHINTKKLVVDKPYTKIDGNYILQLHKEGKFIF
jgi:hypothetical protein